jgi:DNA-binding transcriptional ArsR family regulator
MPRAATTTDAFNAIAEPRRREIIEALADGEPRSVNELVDRLKLAQPTVSKHLGVLRQVGIVSVTKDGQHRMYRLNGGELKAVYDWTKTFEKFWTHQLARIKQRAERIVKEQAQKKT